MVIVPKLVGVGPTDMSGRLLVGELTSDVEFGGPLESDNGMAKQGDRITRLLRSSSCIGGGNGGRFPYYSIVIGGRRLTQETLI